MVEHGFLRRSLSMTNSGEPCSELEEKNNLIQTLKQRLLNQQLQLGYYLRKNLSNQRLVDLSEGSAGRAITQVMPNGNKATIDEIQSKLQESYATLHDLINPEEDSNKDSIPKIQNGECTLYSKIYSKIQKASNQIKKSLAELRLYSDYLVNVESERRALADYVFSLPNELKPTTWRLNECLETNSYKEIKNDTNLNGEKSIANFKNTMLINNEMDKSKVEEYLTQFRRDNEPKTWRLNECLESNSYKEIKNDDTSLNNEEKSIANFKNAMLINNEMGQSKVKQYLTELSRDNGSNTDITLLQPIGDTKYILGLEEKCNKIESELEELKYGLEFEVDMKGQEIKRLKKQLKTANDQVIYFNDKISDLKWSVHLVIEENQLLQDALDQIREERNDESLEYLKEVIDTQKEQIEQLITMISNLKEQTKDIGDKVEALDIENSDVNIYSEENILNCNAANEEEIEEELNTTKYNYMDSTKSKTSIGSKSFIQAKEVRDCSQMTETTTNIPLQPQKTRLEVETLDEAGKTVNLKAVLETVPNFGGILELRSSTTLSLRLHCHAPDFVIKQNEEKVASISSIIDDRVKEEMAETTDEVLEVTESKFSRSKDAVVNNFQNIYSHIFGED